MKGVRCSSQSSSEIPAVEIDARDRRSGWSVILNLLVTALHYFGELCCKIIVASELVLVRIIIFERKFPINNLSTTFLGRPVLSWNDSTIRRHIPHPRSLITIIISKPLILLRPDLLELKCLRRMSELEFNVLIIGPAGI